mgnify:CR=1 FL=1
MKLHDHRLDELATQVPSDIYRPMDRRTFLNLVGALATGPVMAASSHRYLASGRILQRDLLPGPVIIESIDLFERGGDWFVRARSTDGAEGWAVGHPGKTQLCHPVIIRVVAPFMIGKDARDLDHLVDDVFLASSNYKMQGQLFWVAVAAVEFAMLDLLGRVANTSAADLLGGTRRKQIGLYIANNHRHLGPDASLEKIVQSVDSIGAKAVKFKIGGRMRVEDQVPGRTEKLIPMVAEALGDKCTIYADANSSYVSVETAVRIGRLLEANGIAFYEEPCPFDYLEETRRVADALSIPIAWGEQESSQWRFKWMIENGGVQIPQPDLFYYGGLIRSLRVANMAASRNLDCTPHISGGGLGFLYMGIYAACCPNPGPHQEYKGLHKRFPWASTGKPIDVVNGSMIAPTGPGIGVVIDPEFLANARRVS